MLITVPASGSVNLSAVLSATDLPKIIGIKDNMGYVITIQNLGNTDIYIEKNLPADVSKGIKVGTLGGSYSFHCKRIAELNLIADTSENTNVRIIVG